MSAGVLVVLIGMKESGRIAGKSQSEPVLEYYEPEQVASGLEKEEECWLCGDDERSLAGYYRDSDELGIICLNQWYILSLGLQVQEKTDEWFENDGGVHIGYTATGEGGCYFRCEQNRNRRITTVDAEFGSDSLLDVGKIKNHICQKCLDKILEVMGTHGTSKEDARATDLCLIDFKTMEVYALQKHNLNYFVRDYYVRVDTTEGEKVEVVAVYAPMRNKMK